MFSRYGKILPEGCNLSYFENETENNQSVDNAINLALCYLNNDFYSNNQVKAINWLCKAKIYTEESLNKKMDIDKFFSFIKIMETESIFHSNFKELMDSAAKYTEVLRLSSSICRKSNSFSEGIGYFIGKSTKLKTVCFKYDPHSVGTLDSSAAIIIAKGLKINSSVEKLKIQFNDIKDEGVISIVEAIENNSNSKIKKISFRSCGMTDKSAKKIIDLLNKKEQIVAVNVKKNSINPNLQEKIKKIISKRKLIIKEMCE